MKKVHPSRKAYWDNLDPNVKRRLSSLFKKNDKLKGIHDEAMSHPMRKRDVVKTAGLREFAKAALSSQEAARFGPKGVGHRRKKCKAKDISKESVKGTTSSCAPLFSLKQSVGQKAPGGSAEKPETNA